MGLFSWISNKIHEFKYNKAVILSEEGRYDDAINILKELLDEDPIAQLTLLETYHKKIVSRSSNQESTIQEVITLYRHHTQLGTKCIEVAEDLCDKKLYDSAITILKVLLYSDPSVPLKLLNAYSKKLFARTSYQPLIVQDIISLYRTNQDLGKSLIPIAKGLNYLKYYDGAIILYKIILNTYPSVLISLLDSYHSKLLSEPLSKDNIINEILSLYKTYNEIGERCVDYAKELLDKGHYTICICYSAELFEAGLKQVETYFLLSSEKYVLQNLNLSSLKALCSSDILCSDLAQQLRLVLDKYYHQKNLQEAHRIAQLIYPYFSSNLEFRELFFNIQLDIFSLDDINEKTLKVYDELLFEVLRTLSKEKNDVFLKKSFQLAQEKFAKNEYTESLLLCSHLFKY